MLESVLQNLINIGWAMLIFLAAYLARPLGMTTPPYRKK